MDYQKSIENLTKNNQTNLNADDDDEFDFTTSVDNAPIVNHTNINIASPKNDRNVNDSEFYEESNFSVDELTTNNSNTKKPETLTSNPDTFTTSTTPTATNNNNNNKSSSSSENQTKFNIWSAAASSLNEIKSVYGDGLGDVEVRILNSTETNTPTTNNTTNNTNTINTNSNSSNSSNTMTKSISDSYLLTTGITETIHEEDEEEYEKQEMAEALKSEQELLLHSQEAALWDVVTNNNNNNNTNKNSNPNTNIHVETDNNNSNTTTTGSIISTNNDNSNNNSNNNNSNNNSSSDMSSGNYIKSLKYLQQLDLSKFLPLIVTKDDNNDANG